MNPAIKDYIRDFRRRNRVQRYQFLKMANTTNFVEELKEGKAIDREINAFFIALCKEQLKQDGPLPDTGYLDLIRFAKDNHLFTEVGK